MKAKFIKWFPLLALAIIFNSCDYLKEDTEPTLQIEAFALANKPVVVNIHNFIGANPVILIESVEGGQYGTVEVIGGKFIKFSPGLNFAEKIDRVKARLNNATSVEIVFKSQDNNAHCGSSGIYDYVKIKKNSPTIKIDLMANDIFCDAGGFVTGTSERFIVEGFRPYSIQGDQFMDMRIARFHLNPVDVGGTGKLYLEFTPPKDFTGRVSYILDVGIGTGRFTPVDYWSLNASQYFETITSTLIEIDVTEID